LCSCDPAPTLLPVFEFPVAGYLTGNFLQIGANAVPAGVILYSHSSAVRETPRISQAQGILSGRAGIRPSRQGIRLLPLAQKASGAEPAEKQVDDVE
jgi:hypothetical protein